jgi:cation transport ATPase
MKIGISNEEISKLNELATSLMNQGKTCWFVAINKQAICVVAFLDTLRSSAKTVILDLKSRGNNANFSFLQ